MKTFTIDENKWRSGGEGCNKTGFGPTQLLNKYGYMCCLGMICEQSGITKKSMLEIGHPCWLDKSKIEFLAPITQSAIIINDDEKCNLEERKSKLTDLFRKKGIQLIFRKGKKMKSKRKVLRMTVQGQKRNVYVDDNNNGQIYFDRWNGHRTSVTGKVSVNVNGVYRFTPNKNSKNASLLFVY